MFSKSIEGVSLLGPRGPNSSVSSKEMPDVTKTQPKALRAFPGHFRAFQGFQFQFLIPPVPSFVVLLTGMEKSR